MEKTIFILGAGFSIEAGAPSQENLIRTIFELHEQDSSHFQADAIDNFAKFLSDELCIPKDMQKDVPLEDIFTPIDRCLMDNISFRSLNRDRLFVIRETIYYLIGRTLEIRLQNAQHKYVDDFGRYLVELCEQRINLNSFDPVSVLSTNWDILLDNSINNYIWTKYSPEQKAKGVVDYCCYVSSFWENDPSVKPGLEVIGAGGFSVKLLKLHGSLNWLQCPSCSRVYVGFGEKISMNPLGNPRPCRHCKKNFKSESKSINLISNLIMPTFLKNFSNSQYKLIWHNAAIELAEAHRLVFIGYSLPQADFEMRQLLARMTRSTATIDVVDFGIDTDKNIQDLKKRYRVFFGHRNITFHLEGTSKFLMKYLSHSK